MTRITRNAERTQQEIVAAWMIVSVCWRVGCVMPSIQSCVDETGETGQIVAGGLVRKQRSVVVFPTMRSDAKLFVQTVG
ncbi:MAG: hypothetical protein GDA49_12845 [Rhodospirillales bacterium]|nr:hypothetical protein [Rhodospirillales bacterium]